MYCKKVLKQFESGSKNRVFRVIALKKLVFQKFVEKWIGNFGKTRFLEYRHKCELNLVWGLGFLHVWDNLIWLQMLIVYVTKVLYYNPVVLYGIRRWLFDR